jgi:transposase
MTSIGVDVAKGQYEACAVEATRSESFRALDKVVQYIEGYPEPHVILEATGGYERPLCEALAARGVAFTVVNPARAHAFMKSVGRLAKTDAIDARLLARMGHTLQLQPSVLASAERRRLQALVLRRQQLTEELIRQRNHSEHGLDKDVVASIRRVSTVLKKEVLSIERSIKKLLSESAELSEPCRRLQTVPGVGPRVAAGLLVYLPELGKLEHGQAAALAGLAPYNVDSGAHRGQRRIRAGRSPLRALLYMAALVAARRNPVLSGVYKRLRERGKPAKVALIAVARKLLKTLNSMLKHDSDWVANPAALGA